MTPYKLSPRYLLLLCLLSLRLAAQEEEMVELSSFVISSERDSGYVPPMAPKPSVAITLKKPASAVIMEVALMNASEKQENRTKRIRRRQLLAPDKRREDNYCEQADEQRRAS